VRLLDPGIIFIAIGIILLVLAGNLYEHTHRYDNNTACSSTSVCTHKFKVDEEVAGPVFVYYEVRYDLLTQQLLPEPPQVLQIEKC